MPLTTREKRHQRTKDAILQAARQIISENGVGALSIRAIAQRIEYSPAGLYEYFGSKDEIILAVCEIGQLRLRDAMANVSKSLPFPEYMLELGLAYIRFAQQNQDYFMLMFSTPLPIDQSYKEGMEDPERSAFVILLDAIRQGIELGHFIERPGFGAREMAFNAWTVVHGFSMLRITQLQGQTDNEEGLAIQILLNFQKGLSA